jgi:predicted DNA-binding transcriptional regulator AlpA
MRETNPQANEIFLTGPQVRERYGVTDMSIWRWSHDNGVGFPAPTKLGNGRNYWRLSDLVAWEASRAPSMEAPHERAA